MIKLGLKQEHRIQCEIKLGFRQACCFNKMVPKHKKRDQLLHVEKGANIYVSSTLSFGADISLKSDVYIKQMVQVEI